MCLSLGVLLYLRTLQGRACPCFYITYIKTKLTTVVALSPCRPHEYFQMIPQRAEPTLPQASLKESVENKSPLITYFLANFMPIYIISKFTFSSNRKMFSVSALIEWSKQQRTMLNHALCSALVDIRARSMTLTLLIFYYSIRVFPFICLLAHTLVWNDACVIMSCL